MRMNFCIGLFVVALCIQPASAAMFKKFVNKTFGIDATDEDFSDFVPTLANLNVITIHPCAGVDESPLSMAEVAYSIHHKTLPEQAHMAIKAVEQRAFGCWQLHMGIQSTGPTTFVVVRGYAGAAEPAQPGSTERNTGMCAIPRNGGGMITAYQWLKHGILYDTTVTFDYPDSRRYFDFGLENDRMCLDLLYQELIQAGTKPVYVANCRGSKSVLNFLARSKPQEVAAVVLDAPFIDLQTFTQEIGKNYGKNIPYADRIAYKVISNWHSSYNLEDELGLEDLRDIPLHIPIFIGHLKNDVLIADEFMKRMVAQLSQSGHIVYLLVIDDPTKSHSRLYQTEPFKWAVNAFFSKYDIPHHPELAQKGKHLLNYAAYNVRHPEHWYVYKIQ